MISACLLGVNCRYDGDHSACYDLVNFLDHFFFIPFCPEQLGGLPTPRPPANIKGGNGHDVLSGKAILVNAAGQDVTDAFKKGAEEAYSLARLSNTSIAIMKDRSPSCGLETLHRDGETATEVGVTAALFLSRGIRVFELGKNDHFPSKEFLALANDTCVRTR
jgi:uncharacterized protein YbbK (DUF523 family)